MPLYSFYVEPGVYVRTVRQISGVTVPSNLRLAVIIGEGAETVPVQGFAQVRASSSTVDNFSREENVIDRFIDPDTELLITADGTSRKFQVRNLPIVKGDGTGTPSTDPATVSVTINGDPAAVLKIEPEEGIIHLANVALSTDEVLVSYFYDIRDTLITDEDLSFQVNGTATQFKVKFPRIVDGTHGGVTTATPSDITVTVDGVAQTVTVLNGALGVFTLSTAPPSGSTLLVTYYSNRLENTSDPFPESNVVRIVQVGDNPGRPDYINGVDYVLAGGQITWGSAAVVSQGENTPGGALFDAEDVATNLVDNKFYFEELSGTVDGSNVTFTSASQIMDGSGKGIPTDDPTLIQVYVGTDAQDALSNGEVVVTQLYGTTRTVVLAVAPAIGDSVFMTYNYNLLTDAEYEIINKVAGGSGTGEYLVDSDTFGLLPLVEEGSHTVADPNFAIEGIVWPDAFSDLQVFPGIAVDELVTVTFTSQFDFTVTSSNPVGSDGTGRVGQTYVDSKTGLRFTLLDPQTTPFVANPYDFALGDTLEFMVDVGANIIASSIPYIQIPGLWMIVQDTTGVEVDDSAILNTYNKSGSEPAVGSVYYIDYEFEKTDFSTKVISNESENEIVNGPVNVSNGLSLAVRMALRNGALLVGAKQVKREIGSAKANSQAYIEAIDSQKKRLAGNRNQDLLVPLTGDADVFGFLKKHVETQSNEFNRNRRMALVGFDLQTEPEEAIEVAKSLNSERMIAVYPDGCVTQVLDDNDRVLEAVVPGYFLAAGLAGAISSQGFDSASSFLQVELTDYVRLTRDEDSDVRNSVITAGTTYLIEGATSIEVLDAYTTRYGSLLLEEPNVTLIDDEIARDGYLALKPFVGVKSLPGLENDIEAVVSSLMQSKVQSRIIAEYRNIIVVIDEDDPRVAYITLGYRPIFTLKWLSLTLQVRSRFN